MTTQYMMRAILNGTTPIYWINVGSADNTGTNSGYNPANLTSISVNYITSGAINTGTSNTSSTIGISSRYVVSPRVGEGQYHTTGTNDHLVINQALTDAVNTGGANEGTVILMEGNYNCAGSIVLPDQSNVSLRGVGKNRSYLNFNNLTTNCIIRASAVTTRYKYEISSLAIDNQLKTNSGGVGIYINNISNCLFRDITITNCETGIILDNSAYFNNFDNIDLEECGTGIKIQGQSNENRFYSIKCTKASGGTGIDFPLYILSGNDNKFFGCSFEDFLTAVRISDIGNHFFGCRIECNNRSGTITYIQLDSNANNNSFISPYFSGNEWISRTTSIVNNGAGNYIESLSTFKDQFIQGERNLITAGDMIHYTRTGSGDGYSVIIAEDTYSNSGIPTQFLAKGVRNAGFFIQGQLSGTTNFSVTGAGQGYFANGLVVTGPIDNQWSPNIEGYIAWVYDPVAAVNSTVPTGGASQVVRLEISKATTINNIYLWCSVAGSGTTNCYAALYNSSGTFLVQSTDQSSTMGTSGMKTFPVTAQAVSAGFIYVLFWATATTTVPAFARAAGTGIGNFNLGSNYRYSTADTGLTTTAPSPMGTRTSGSISWWAAVA